MEQFGEYPIQAPRETVWRALNDVDILRECIPNCRAIVKHSDTRFDATIKAKIGPVSGTFEGEIELSDINPPNSYRITGSASGGMAGFAKGGASVTLIPDGNATILKYAVQAQLGGKILQVGSRLVDGVVRSTAEQFFENFVKSCSEHAVPPEFDGEFPPRPACPELAGLATGKSHDVDGRRTGNGFIWLAAGLCLIWLALTYQYFFGAWPLLADLKS